MFREFNRTALMETPMVSRVVVLSPPDLLKPFVLQYGGLIVMQAVGKSQVIHEGRYYLVKLWVIPSCMASRR